MRRLTPVRDISRGPTGLPSFNDRTIEKLGRFGDEALGLNTAAIHTFASALCFGRPMMIPSPRRVAAITLVVTIVALMAVDTAVASTITIGDVDGFGFTPPSGVRATPFPHTTPADTNGDGVVQLFTLQGAGGDGLIQLATTTVPFAALLDGQVIASLIAPNESYLAIDYVQLVRPDAVTPVPEPTSISLVLLGGAGMLLRRRRRARRAHWPTPLSRDESFVARH